MLCPPVVGADMGGDCDMKDGVVTAIGERVESRGEDPEATLLVVGAEWWRMSNLRRWMESS